MGVNCMGKMDIRIHSLFFICLAILSACTVFRGEQVHKIALLAPFEGRYREIGYDALYAVRLAIADSAITNIDLLAIDDGGSIESAIDRAKAIQEDSAIEVVLALGPYATVPEVQAAYGDIPVIIVGHWNAESLQENIFVLAHAEMSVQLTYHENRVFVESSTPEIYASEILALKQVPLLFNEDNLANLYILSSSTLADEAFYQRYIHSAQFVPEPGLLTTLSYDATGIALEVITTNDSSPTEIEYEGINGRIRFANGFWLDAPIHQYGYDHSGQLAILQP
jgi:hypothetical protein